MKSRGMFGAHHSVETLDAELQVRLFGAFGHTSTMPQPSADGAHGAAGNLHDESRSGSGALLDAVVVNAALVAHGAFAE